MPGAGDEQAVGIFQDIVQAGIEFVVEIESLIGEEGDSLMFDGCVGRAHDLGDGIATGRGTAKTYEEGSPRQSR